LKRQKFVKKALDHIVVTDIDVHSGYQ